MSPVIISQQGPTSRLFHCSGSAATGRAELRNAAVRNPVSELFYNVGKASTFTSRKEDEGGK